jgi:long-chain acyl-CoA synthetase
MTETTAVNESAQWGAKTTILDLFSARVASRAEHVALRARGERDAWISTTWGAYGRIVDEVAAGLIAMGIEPGDRVAILSWNRAEWQSADIGILSTGAISVPIYPTSASVQVAYVLRHSGSRCCFVENSEQLGRVLEHREQAKALERIVVMEGDVALDNPELLSFAHLCALGAQLLERDPDVVDRARRAVVLDDVATLVYTSGTTGPPKGAVITHGNIMSMLRSVTEIVPLTPSDRFLSFLPLSHITERSVSHFGLIASGGETWFAQSISTVAADLPQCRPTIFFAVPRLWEKMRDGIEEHVAQLTGVRHSLAHRYLALAALRARDPEQSRAMPVHLKAEYLALDAIIGARLRHEIGLDKARILVSGAAPIHPDVLRWFNGVGLAVAEGYGQTEVALATSLNPPGAARIGTVGPPIPGVSVRIADDSEILVKGDNVCRGYWRDDDATRALIDEEGWLHTGDLGTFDERRYLRITGRKKDLIITAHGKNISPQNIETDLETTPLIGQAVVVGDGRRYLTALLALDGESVAQWARDHGKDGTGLEALAGDADLRAQVADVVAEVNARHAQVEHIRHWRVLPRELTIAEGELTPTLKVKRAIVNEHFAGLIEDMYAQPSPAQTN